MRRGLALLVLVVCAGCGGAATPAPGPAPSSDLPNITDVAGTVVVTDLRAVRTDADGETCVALAPYDDVAAGAQVTVTNENGDRIALAALGTGRLEQGTGGARPGCTFAFSYNRAEAGRTTYLARVGDREPVEVPVADLTRIRIDVPAG